MKIEFGNAAHFYKNYYYGHRTRHGLSALQQRVFIEYHDGHDANFALWSFAVYHNESCNTNFAMWMF